MIASRFIGKTHMADFVELAEPVDLVALTGPVDLVELASPDDFVELTGPVGYYIHKCLFRVTKCGFHISYFLRYHPDKFPV